MKYLAIAVALLLPLSSIAEGGKNTSVLQCFRSNESLTLWIFDLSVADKDGYITLESDPLGSRLYFREQNSGKIGVPYYFLSMGSGGGDFNLFGSAKRRTTEIEPSKFIQIKFQPTNERPWSVEVDDMVFDICTLVK